MLKEYDARQRQCLRGRWSKGGFHFQTLTNVYLLPKMLVVRNVFLLQCLDSEEPIVMIALNTVNFLTSWKVVSCPSKILFDGLVCGVPCKVTSVASEGTCQQMLMASIRLSSPDVSYSPRQINQPRSTREKFGLGKWEARGGGGLNITTTIAT
jgi:hypothetical protein